MSHTLLLSYLTEPKGNQLSGAKFEVPCVGVTEGMHIQPGRWVKRLVESNQAVGVRGGGHLFAHNKLVPVKLFEFDNDFFVLLEWGVQA
jgi:hypothetical protein